MAAGQRNIQARRRLSELYARGCMVRFAPNPDGGDPIVEVGALKEPYFTTPGPDGTPIPYTPGEDEILMWVQPPSPDQRDMALRDAQAARARALINTKTKEDSEEHLTTKAFLVEMSLSTLIDYLLVEGEGERRNEAMREVIANGDWDDFDALRDAMRQFEESGADEDDPEWAGLLEKDREYGRQVRAAEHQLRETARESLALIPRGELERRALEKRAELVGSQAFVREYELQMTFYAVRDPDNHGELFFESAREVTRQEDGVRMAIAEALSKFIGEVGEAKNSPRAASGSDSSTLPSEPEISAASTPEVPSA